MEKSGRSGKVPFWMYFTIEWSQIIEKLLKTLFIIA